MNSCVDPTTVSRDLNKQGVFTRGVMNLSVSVTELLWFKDFTRKSKLKLRTSVLLKKANTKLWVDTSADTAAS